MKRWCSIAFAVGGIICLLGLWFVKRESRVGEPAGTAARLGTPPVTASGLGDSTYPDTPAVVHQDMGRLELVRRVVIPDVQLAPEVVADPPVHVKFGDAPTVKFVLRDKDSGSAKPVANPSASVFHGSDPVLQVPVLDAGDGVYEVAFTPTGPGQFNVVLNDGALPIASRKIGVVGVAGDPGKSADANFLAVDPREARMRTGARARRR